MPSNSECSVKSESHEISWVSWYQGQLPLCSEARPATHTSLNCPAPFLGAPQSLCAGGLAQGKEGKSGGEGDEGAVKEELLCVSNTSCGCRQKKDHSLWPSV